MKSAYGKARYKSFNKCHMLIVLLINVSVNDTYFYFYKLDFFVY